MRKISLIIPVFNDNEELLKLLHHFQNVTNIEYIEIIIVSADLHNELTGRVDSKIKILHSKIACRAIQLNSGAAEATGEILYFVHADTLPPISLVKDINDAVEAGQLMGGYRLKFNPNSILLNINSFFTRFSTKFSGGGDQTLYITKELFNKYEGYDERYCIMEDFELVHRLKPVHGYHIIPKNVIVSSRKYLYNNYLRVNFANYQAFKMYRRKVAPEIIKEYYYASLH
ncbi:MAG TPA: glycosyltransferase family 2 protein [Anditalea sp.]|nr:glycosyltransferase family 2 protein [Anditalea sp.]